MYRRDEKGQIVKERDHLAEHLIAKSIGNDPQAIAEKRRQLEAGIDPSPLVVKATVVKIG